MKANSLRSGSPGVRLGLALMTSLLLHAALLMATSFKLPQKPPEHILQVRLPVPETPPAAALTTQPQAPLAPAEPPPAEILTPPPASAVTPQPTIARPPAPQPLAGRALDKALAALTKEEFYPREAIARGLEGKVVLLLTLAEGGAVTGIEVASSSGHALLDEAALKAAGRIRSLPGGRRQVLLPVEFRLD
jgi:periplasmic protein TonB